MTLYPLALKLTGRRVLVVGGGAVATRRVPALLGAGAAVEIVAPELSPALRGIVDAGRAAWHARRFEPADLDDAWLVQVAIDDPAAAEQVSAAAEERRVFCVRADDRDAATAWTPAVTRYGPVTVAVLGGGDPRRAVEVRDAIRDRLIDGTLPGADPGIYPESEPGPVDDGDGVDDVPAVSALDATGP
ncbi:MAG: bifunctional precorrin-2 dehydrogenase/sirohydrochlorin ferrochelatase, partial [Actinoplanes sp.]